MPISPYNFGSPPKFADLVMRDFLGVDFANDPSEVSLRRSPEAKNILSSYNNVIEKRYGHTVEHNFGSKINMVYRNTILDLGVEKQTSYVHAGNYLWSKNGIYWEKVEYLTPTSATKHVLWVNQPLVWVEEENPANNYFYLTGLDTGDYNLVENSEVEFAPRGYLPVGYLATFATNTKYYVHIVDAPTGKFNLMTEASNTATIIYPRFYNVPTGEEPFAMREAYTHNYVYLTNGRTQIFNFQETGNYARYYLSGSGALIQIMVRSVYEQDFAIDICGCPLYNDAYIPTTVIARAPTGGGTPYEDINLVQRFRINSFLGTAGATAYQLDATNLDARRTTDDYGFTLTGIYTNIHVQKLVSAGTWDDLEYTTDYTFAPDTGIVTFVTAPGVSPVTGVDNIKIYFSKQNTANESIIKNCWFSASFGFNGQDDYIFMAGDTSMPNMDYRGRKADLYFPETGYTQFGSTQSRVMGYGRMGEYLTIHKTSYLEEKTIFLRSVSLDTNDEVIFPMSRGVVGVGVESPTSFGNLRDDPLWLSELGVVALVKSPVTGVTAVQERGYYVNKRILSTENLAEAVAYTFDNKYFLAFPTTGHIYLADARKRYREEKSASESFQYEWYYWDNLFITSFYTDGDRLYFGTTDGKLCSFKKAGDPHPYLDDTTPVNARWCSPILYMGNITAKKTLKNAWLRLSQYTRSGVNVYYRSKGDSVLAKSKTFDIFDFTDIDFTRFTFETDVAPEVVVTNRVMRQFMSIQFMVENTAEEGLGLIEFVARYRVNSAYKGG